jgi:hypothetical protein
MLLAFSAVTPAKDDHGAVEIDQSHTLQPAMIA